jgi:hypothetical protein
LIWAHFKKGKRKFRKKKIKIKKCTKFMYPTYPEILKILLFSKSIGNPLK